MKLELSIHRAGLADLPEAAALVRKVVRECVSAWLERGAIDEYCDFATALALNSRYRAGHEFWIARWHGLAIGVLEVKPPSHVLMLFVHPEFQRAGVGRTLLACAFPGFPHSPAQTITVNSVPQSVPAYERMGFIRSGQEQNVKGIRFVPMEMAVPVSTV